MTKSVTYHVAQMTILIKQDIELNLPFSEGSLLLPAGAAASDIVSLCWVACIRLSVQHAHTGSTHRTCAQSRSDDWPPLACTLRVEIRTETTAALADLGTVEATKDLPAVQWLRQQRQCYDNKDPALRNGAQLLHRFSHANHNTTARPKKRSRQT